MQRRSRGAGGLATLILAGLSLDGTDGFVATLAQRVSAARGTHYGAAVWKPRVFMTFSDDNAEARARRVASFCAEGPCVSPSVAKANVKKLGEELEAAVAAGSKALHFGPQSPPMVPKMNWVHPDMVKAVRSDFPDVVMEAKLSVCLRNPIECEWTINQWVKAGTDAIYIHPESTSQPLAVLNHIKKAGCASGLVINPDTPVAGQVSESIKAGMVDVAVFMLVSPGAGKRFDGANYIESALRKMKEVDEIAEAAGVKVLKSVDGGVSPKNAEVLKAAGADILVSGGALFKGSAADKKAVVDQLLR